MKQSFGQKGAGGRFLALALALIMLCSVLVPAYAAVVDEQGVAEQNEPAATGSVTYIFYVGGETVQEVKVASGEALTKPTDPNAPEGEVFKGWFVDNDLNKPFTFGTTVSTHADEAVHLYAHFETAVAASTEQQPAAPEQPAAPGTSEEPKQPETNTPTDGGEENKGEQGSTENNENQTGENQNTENTGKNTGDTTTSDPTTPTDPVPPIEPIVPAEAVPAEGKVQPVDEFYNRLMACATLDEINAILNNLTEEEDALLEQFTEEQNAALEDKMAEFGAYGIDTLDDKSYSTPQNSTLKIAVDVSSTINSATITKCNPPVTGFSVAPYTEYTDDYDSVERGLSFTIGENVPVNDYTLTVQYTYLDYSGGGFPTDPGGSSSKTETITIKLKVTQEQAQVYYLKTPTSNPDSNATSQWGDCVGSGTVDTTGATWTNDKNIFSPLAYVRSMPDDMVDQEDGMWLLPKDKYPAHFTAIYNAYKSALGKELGITLESEDDIKAIYLVPYKISRNNNTTPDKHIDCTISVKTTKVFAAVFLVTMPDETVEQVDAKNYKKDSAIKKTGEAPTDNAGKYPATKTVNGITYVFDGWYNEVGDKVTDEEWKNYYPNDAELADGTVYFKAKYVPATTSVTISKLATGTLGSTEKEFTFTYKVYGKDGDEIETGIYPEDSTAEKQEFTLKGNGTDSVKISNLPVGGKITFTEETYEGYTLYYQLGVDASDYDATQRRPASGRSYTFTIESSDEGNKILFINDKDPVPDTGILLDSWPYILALAFVTAGAVLTLAHKRRRDVD